jgi:uncharacterized protein YacL (UPF0231 family)
MPTIQEITTALSNLNTDELHYIEQTIHNLYRARHECIIYDDDYGIWTEQDQISAAAAVFNLLDKEEDLEDNANT